MEKTSISLKVSLSVVGHKEAALLQWQFHHQLIPFRQNYFNLTNCHVTVVTLSHMDYLDCVFSSLLTVFFQFWFSTIFRIVELVSALMSSLTTVLCLTLFFGNNLQPEEEDQCDPDCQHSALLRLNLNLWVRRTGNCVEDTPTVGYNERTLPLLLLFRRPSFYIYLWFSRPIKMYSVCLQKTWSHYFS